MSIKRISIDEFLETKQNLIILDVRSPLEFDHAHIPNAVNTPLFTNEERKIVGTLYKQEGKHAAIKTGLGFFGVKMKHYVENVESIYKINSTKKILVHCWRGGMRSAAIAWLLDLYGFEVRVLNRGYKEYRTWSLCQFEKSYNFKILGGFTGSSKTELLAEIKKNNNATIDLEFLANHKGSAFGGIGQPNQPSQEMFENLLAKELYQNSMHSNKPIWIEDESQRIGRVNLPHSLWKQIRKSPLYFIDIPFEKRAAYILQQYGTLNIDLLITATERISKRLGPNETKICINYLKENKITEAIKILLSYYDKGYVKAMNQRETLQEQLTTISSPTFNPIQNIKLLKNYL